MYSRGATLDKLTNALEATKADPYFDENFHFVLNRIERAIKKYTPATVDDIEIWINADGNLSVKPTIGGVARKTVFISPATLKKLKDEDDDILFD